MAQSDTKHVTPVSLVIDAVLVVAFFAVIYSLVSGHVPSHDKTNVLIWGGLTSACMSCVFWLCIQMCRVVYRAQKANRQ